MGQKRRYLDCSLAGGGISFDGLDSDTEILQCHRKAASRGVLTLRLALITRWRRKSKEQRQYAWLPLVLSSSAVRLSVLLLAMLSLRLISTRQM